MKNVMPQKGRVVFTEWFDLNVRDLGHVRSSSWCDNIFLKKKKEKKIVTM